MDNKEIYALLIAVLLGVTLWLLVCFGLAHLVFFFFPAITWGFWKVFWGLVVVTFILNSLGK